MPRHPLGGASNSADRRGASVRLALVLELAVGAGVEQGLVAVIEPHEVRRTAVGSADLEDLAMTVGLADLLAVDDEAFADDACIVAPPARSSVRPGPAPRKGSRGSRGGAGRPGMAPGGVAR